MVRRLSTLLLAVPLIMGIERFCHSQTDGFAIVNILSPMDYQPKWSGGEPIPEALLNQKFHYLDCGAQSYVFLGEDGSTILKFFKNQHMRIPPWLESLWLPPSLATYRDAKKKRKAQAKEQTFISAEIAYHFLKDETGLLYLHLSQTTADSKKVTIVDKLGIEHKVDLKRAPFYLQKRAELAYRYIASHPDKREQAVAKLISLTAKRCRKAIKDKDPDFSTNFGFIGDEVVQIDIGRFSLQDHFEKGDLKDELVRITRPLQDWLRSQEPPPGDLIDLLIEQETPL